MAQHRLVGNAIVLMSLICGSLSLSSGAQSTTMEEAHRNPSCRQYDEAAPRWHNMVETIKAKGTTNCASLRKSVTMESRLPPLARSCGTPKLIANMAAMEAEYQHNLAYYQQNCGR